MQYWHKCRRPAVPLVSQPVPPGRLTATVPGNMREQLHATTGLPYWIPFISDLRSFSPYCQAVCTRCLISQCCYGFGQICCAPHLYLIPQRSGRKFVVPPAIQLAATSIRSVLLLSAGSNVRSSSWCYSTACILRVWEANGI